MKVNQYFPNLMVTCEMLPIVLWHADNIYCIFIHAVDKNVKNLFLLCTGFDVIDIPIENKHAEHVSWLFSADWTLLLLSVFPYPFNVLQKPRLKICSFLSLSRFSMLLGLLLKLQYKAHKEIKHKSIKIQSDCWAKPTKLRDLVLLEYLDVLGVTECRSIVLLSLRMS